MLSRLNPWCVSGLAGVLFVALSMLASFANVQPPAYDSESAGIAAWLAEHDDRYRTGHFVAGLAFLLFYFPFIAGVYARLSDAEGSPFLWSRTALVGAVLSPATGTIAGTFIMGAALLGDDTEPGVAAFALAGNFYAYVVSGGFSGVAMLGASVVILRTAVFPRWLGWAGLLAAASAIAGTAAIVEDDPGGIFAGLNGLAWFAFFAWLLALAISLLQTAASEPGRPRR